MKLYKICLFIIFFISTHMISAESKGGRDKPGRENKRESKHIDVKSNPEKPVKPLEEIRKEEKNSDSDKREEHKDKNQKVIRNESNRPLNTESIRQIKSSEKNIKLKESDDHGLIKRESAIKRNNVKKEKTNKR